MLRRLGRGLRRGLRGPRPGAAARRRDQAAARARTDGRAVRCKLEAQALARITHPNVVPVFEVGEHDGEVFIGWS
ncbi:MAG: hypothetical protein U0168_16385 [Nannocystaceae bacterium]